MLQLAENEANSWWLWIIEKFKIYPKTIQYKLKAYVYIIGPVLGLVSKQEEQVFLGSLMETIFPNIGEEIYMKNKSRVLLSQRYEKV